MFHVHVTNKKVAYFHKSLATTLKVHTVFYGTVLYTILQLISNLCHILVTPYYPIDLSVMILIMFRLAGSIHTPFFHSISNSTVQHNNWNNLGAIHFYSQQMLLKKMQCIQHFVISCDMLNKVQFCHQTTITNNKSELIETVINVIDHRIWDRKDKVWTKL